MSGAADKIKEEKPFILLAEDNASYREGLVMLLESEGYRVHAVADGLTAVGCFPYVRPDLVLLDIMMPEKNGYEVCRRIRTLNNTVPILFLTAKNKAADELRGFTVGADDFIPKTADDSVILARLSNALRHALPNQSFETQFQFGGGLVDAVNLRFVQRAGAPKELSIKEVELLRIFYHHKGQTLSVDELITRVWGAHSDVGENVLRKTIFRLREKLGDVGAQITSLYGKGYHYNP